jgi:hypothetical protein
VAGEAGTFLLERRFIADEDNLDVELFHSLNGALDARGGAMVAPHRIKRNLHTRWCTHR